MKVYRTVARVMGLEEGVGRNHQLFFPYIALYYLICGKKNVYYFCTLHNYMHLKNQIKEKNTQGILNSIWHIVDVL